METAIRLTEVAPTLGKEGRRFLDQIDAASEGANPGLARLALKLATGAGKTTVMAMLIAWQTINAVRRPGKPATLVKGRLPLFRNFDEHGNPHPCPRTLLIDSEQLDSGEALDKHFRAAVGEEIERFRREIVARTGDRRDAEHRSDQDLLREVMNTVGKPDTLGGSWERSERP